MSFAVFPQVSPPVGAATVVRWRTQPGDSIEAGDLLVELEAEQVLIQVEAATGGKVAEILAQPGQTVEVGTNLARFDSVSSPPSAESNTRAEEIVSNQPSAPGGKVTPILMPQAGNTMEEGTVIAWRVEPGAQIAVGQILCEIETDKATMDFESPDAGRLARIVAPVGEPIAVKELIALLAENDADADAYIAGQGSSTPAVASASVPATSPTPVNGVGTKRSPAAPAAMTAEGRVKASPAARKLAAERGVELSAVGAGSGPGGRILTAELQGFESTEAATSAAGNGEAIRKPMSKMRRAIGLNLQQSKQTVPHFYVRTTIDADPLLAFYREQKTATHCTLNDVIVLAVGRTIAEFPAVRSQIVGNEIVEYPHANIGVAVGIDDGLVVPVVMDVDTLPLARLAAEAKRLVDQARKGRLENIGQGHFTISNLGMFGVEEFSAIINPPESGILAVSAAREAVIVENGAMRAGRTMTMTLSADHRIVDGVMAARFMQRLKEVLEHPDKELA
jgi:pyruvate dehydrogenase E2 component (dihydrolipoyllysine-residue acetyltransferase)